MIGNINDDTPQTYTKEELKSKWLKYSIGGIMLFSFGLCLFSEAANLKHAGKDMATWIIFGTISLICINAGLSLFGQGVIYKSQYDIKLRRKLFFKKNNNRKKQVKKKNDSNTKS